MIEVVGTLHDQYTTAISAYLMAPLEAELCLAYEIGRSALGCGQGVLDIAVVHHGALRGLMHADSPQIESERMQRAAEFFAETLAPFEMSLRGYRERNDRLAALNAELREANAKATAANEELESFSFSVSHDLRAPLRAIDGFSRILLEDHADSLDSEGRRIFGLLCDSAVRMSQMIEDILTFSRMGRAPLKTEPVHMAAMARRAVAELAIGNSAQAQAIDIGDLPDAYGDKAMLQRVWMNLLDNAMKYTSHRVNARIEVGAVALDGETTYYVRDNGAGFNTEYAGKLFGVFQRLHGSDFPGTGVGLAIVKKVVTRHGGRVWAEGKEGEGATFNFALPQGGSSRSVEQAISR
jgi:light-regulated signal transduction histidine kinase (bacteriophytochrome)